jgi:K+-transporting ATPase A subunit
MPILPSGLVVGVAFVSGLARQLSDTLGNFCVDLTRALLWVLLPGALIGAVSARLAGQLLPENWFAPALNQRVNKRSVWAFAANEQQKTVLESKAAHTVVRAASNS